MSAVSGLIAELNKETDMPIAAIKQDIKLPPLTKQEVITRITFMIQNCQKPDTVVALKNALSYVKRLKEPV